MFYVENILAKKGPLGKIWIAAHWDKKLSKTQIYQTDIPTAVSYVKSPSAPHALRLSGQLLLGVVRIYLRKAKYLLDDCGEAVTKIQIAFVPGIVDLPAEISVAPYNAITLPENFENVNMLLPEPSEYPAFGFEYRPEAVSEVGLRNTLIDVEPSLDTSERSVEVRRQTGQVSIGEITMSDISTSRRDDTFDGFGMDGFGMEPEPVQEPFIEPIRRFSPPPQDHIVDWDTTIFQDIEPVPKAQPEAKPSQPEKKQKKRKLQIDENVEISGPEIKRQIEDWNEIVREQEFLPSTKKALKEKEEESRDLQLLLDTPPAFYGLSEDLQQLVSSHMIVQVPESIQEKETARAAEVEEPVEKEESSKQRKKRKEREQVTPIQHDISDFGDVSGARDFGSTSEYPMQDISGSRGEAGDDHQPILGGDFNYDDYDQGAAREDEDTELVGPSTTTGKISKQTSQMIVFFQEEFNKNKKKPLGSEQIFNGKSKKVVASTFFEMLVLKTRGLIQVEQPEPYGEIIVKPEAELFKVK